jgi:hypothetical protein
LAAAVSVPFTFSAGSPACARVALTSDTSCDPMSPPVTPAAAAACTVVTVPVGDGVGVGVGVTVVVVVGPGVIKLEARGVLDGVGDAPGVLETDGVGEADAGVEDADGPTVGVAVAAAANEAVGKLKTGVALASRLDAVIGLKGETGSIRMPSCGPAGVVTLGATRGPLPQATAVIPNTPSVKSRATADRPARHPCNNIT